MRGTTGLRALEISCIIGIYERERSEPQPVLVDIELDYDLGGAAASDAIAEAVDYDVVATELTRLAQQGRFALLETLAERAAARLFERLPAVRAIRMEIRKPRAVAEAACAFVRVERSRS